MVTQRRPCTVSVIKQSSASKHDLNQSIPNGTILSKVRDMFSFLSVIRVKKLIRTILPRRPRRVFFFFHKCHLYVCQTIFTHDIVSTETKVLSATCGKQIKGLALIVTTKMYRNDLILELQDGTSRLIKFLQRKVFPKSNTTSFGCEQTQINFTDQNLK